MTAVDNYAFFSAVLRTVACTPNLRRDGGEESRAAVIAATARIREIEKGLTGVADARTIEEVLDLLDLVLTEKAVAEDDREHYGALIRATGAPADVLLRARRDRVPG